MRGKESAKIPGDRKSELKRDRREQSPPGV